MLLKQVREDIPVLNLKFLSISNSFAVVPLLLQVTCELVINVCL